MSDYYMELHDSQYDTIKVAYDYIKKTYPHLTDGFNLCAEHIYDFKKYSKPVFHWHDSDSFLYWGHKGETKIPFPDTSCILLGEII